MNRLLLAGLLLGSTVAYAHNAAHWIETNPNFISGLLHPDQAGTHCCGPSDCTPFPEEHVEQKSDGYHLSNGEVIPYGKTYYTDADQVKVSAYWRCIFTSNTIGSVPHKVGETRCFFAPGGAS